MGKFFDDIKEGLEEAIAFEQGKTTLRTRMVELPDPPENYTSKDIKKIRENIHVSQSIFARYLNVSVKTVRSWEAGDRVPSHCALRLLELIEREVYQPTALKIQPTAKAKHVSVSKSCTNRMPSKRLQSA